MPLVASLPAALVLAVVHLLAGKLRFLHVIPRSRWLSAASGVSVAYVFVHLLPEVEAAGQVISESAGTTLQVIEHHVWLVALSGLAVFYGLERLAVQSRAAGRAERGHDRTGAGVFWVHVVSYGIYNVLIGYLLVHRDERDLQGHVLFTVAIALHFAVNDYGLREHHKDAYTRTGRWVLSATVLLGWVIGVATMVDQAVLATLLGFLAGGIILNVLKEELPEERESRFWAFAAGAAGYAALLVAI